MFNHWVKYLAFCIYFKLALLPAQTLMLTWFAQHLSKSLRAHASIVSCLSSVKNLHRLLNVTTRGFTGFLLKLTLQGLCRTSTHITKWALHVMPALLRCIYNQLDHQSPDDVVFWGACLTAFFLLFRKSNLVSDSKLGFNSNQQLKRSNVVFTEVNAVVGIRWAKNEQFSRDLLMFPLPRLLGSLLCPHTAVKKYL